MPEKKIKRLHTIVESYAQNQEFMGTVLIAKENDILLHRGYGHANLEWGVLNDPKTKFRLGSITKQFTAAAILMLEERGLLNTDDFIAKHIPKAPAAWKNIKLFHLLNHTHGIPNYTQSPEFRAITAFKKTPWEQIQLFIDKPLDFEPGTKYCYNNSGYVLLGHLIEQLTDLSYASFIREHIFLPLGMNDSGYDAFTEIIPYRASGYWKDPAGHFSNAEYLDMSLPYAAGSLYSTATDLLRWTQCLFNFNLISADSLKKMTTPFKEHYGFGVEVKEIDGIKAIMHIGGINGFHSALVYSPTTQTTIAVLSNLNTFGYVWDIGFIAQNLALKLLFTAHGKDVLLPEEKQSKTIATKDLQHLVGDYRIKENLNLTIAMNRGQVEANFSNQHAILLHAEANNAFYAVRPDIQVKFLKNKAGEVTHVHLSQSGYELMGEKIIPQH